MGRITVATREIVAARSVSAAGLAAGDPFFTVVTLTKNEDEIALAMSAPGTVFWRPDDSSLDEAQTSDWHPTARE